MLNLDARPSGGAAIEALALQGNAHAVRFPVPLAKRKDCNFSFAGLKTSVLHAVTGAAFGEACEANLQVLALALRHKTCVDSIAHSMCDICNSRSLLLLMIRSLKILSVCR